MAPVHPENSNTLIRRDFRAAPPRPFDGTCAPKGGLERHHPPRFALGETASPRKTSKARLSLRMSSSSRRPIRAPSLDFCIVVTLSSMSRQDARKPFCPFSSTVSLNNGASVASVVKAHMVIESVPSKLSSCTVTTGRGLPVLATLHVREHCQGVAPHDVLTARVAPPIG